MRWSRVKRRAGQLGNEDRKLCFDGGRDQAREIQFVEEISDGAQTGSFWPIWIFRYLIQRPFPPSNLGERLRGAVPCPLGKASPNGGEACFVGTLSNLGATPSESRWIGTKPSDEEAGVRRSAFTCCF